MAQNKDFTDKENVDVAMLEYKDGIKVGSGLTINDDKTYIGTGSQIYDNVNGHEEQVYVLTNKESGLTEAEIKDSNGSLRGAVPYSASDAERAQVQDVTVMMQGSQTKTHTPKLIHDTVTDWLPTDFVTASHRLGPVGAV